MYTVTIQARMGSSRFPGKVLKELYNDMSVLECMIERIEWTKKVDQIIVLTTNNKKDDEIADLCRDIKVSYFRGDENDVLKRMIQYINKDNYKGYIVDLTSDCPLIDPKMIDRMILETEIREYDFYSNCLTRGLPDGFDIQIYRAELLKILNPYVTHKAHREHTGWNIVHYSGLLQRFNNFKFGNMYVHPDLFMPELGLTVDHKEDLKLIKKVFKHFNNFTFDCNDVVSFIKENKHLIEINSEIKRKTPGVS